MNGMFRTCVALQMKQVLQETGSLFECFPYVCPEPVLVHRMIFFTSKWTKSAVFSPGVLPAALWVFVPAPVNISVKPAETSAIRVS